MEDLLRRQYFLAPQQTTHRRYEALRAVFVAEEPLADVARRFGYEVSTLRSMACRFRAECRRGVTPPFSCRTVAGVIPGGVGAITDADRSYLRSLTAAP
jgi:hypothetical protein